MEIQADYSTLEETEHLLQRDNEAMTGMIAALQAYETSLKWLSAETRETLAQITDLDSPLEVKAHILRFKKGDQR